MIFFFFLLASLLSLVSALPLASPVIRDVWVPKILSPNSSSVWTVGSTYTVAWNISSQPSQVTNPLGMIYLRHGNATQATPIAQGFPLNAGAVDVTIPTDTQPLSDWILVLFGDSGNWSPPFNIIASPYDT